MIRFALILALSAPQEGWTHLPLPGIAREPATGALPEPLLRGVHLDLGREPRPRAGEGGRPAPAALPASLLVGLVQEEARRAGAGLTVLSAGPSLVARGPRESLEALRKRLDDLDRAGERLSIEVEAWLVPGGAPTGAPTPTRGDPPPGAERAREQGLAWRASARSGEPLFLGRREGRPFLAAYQIEVASDSGVAAPIVGRVSLGRTLHLVACRAARGTVVHVEGLLDIAELVRLERFDPGTPDLGIVEQPVVDAVQVAFAAALAPGELVRVDLEGLEFEVPRWTLWLRLTTQPDAQASAGPGWDLLDLAFLARAPRELAGLEPDALPGPEVRLPRVLEALAPQSLAAASSTDPRRTDYPTFTDRLALVERGDGSALRALHELTAAHEAPRLSTRRVTLRLGALRVSLPLTHGVQACVRVGRERTWLVDYDAQIAPDTWMPLPIVQRAFDGLAWHGVLDGERLEGTYWIASTPSVEVRAAHEARLGSLQLPVRRLRAGMGTLRVGGGPVELLASDPDGAPALVLEAP